MKYSKEIIITLIFLLLGSNIYSQTVDEKTSVNQAVSESATYKPVELSGIRKKKEKKSKAKKDAVALVETNDDSIIIPVSVLGKNGKFVQNLKPDDFKVFVDDRETEFSIVENKDEPLNVIMLFDVSPSTESRVEQIRKIASKIVDGLKPEDKVQIIKFSEKFQVVSNPTNDRKIIDKSFGKLKLSGGTALYDTIYKLYTEYVPNMTGRRVLIVFTDGVDTMSDKADFYGSLVEAEKTDIPVYPVYFNTFVDFSKTKLKPSGFPAGNANANANLGLGTSFSEYEIGKFYLNELIKLSGGRAIIAENLNLDKNTDETYIIDDVRSKYYLKIKPTDSQENQRREIKISVNKPGLKIFSRGSYISKPD